MPNYVTTQITTSPNVMAAIMRPATPEDKSPWGGEVPDRVVDFNLIIKAPEIGDPIYTATYYPRDGGGWGNDGYSRLDWCRDNWGTKWNAGDQSYEAVAGDLIQVRIETAWSFPEPIIHALSKKFPEDVIEVEFASEDLGGHVARYKVLNGNEFDVEQPEEYTDEARDMASRIRYGMSYADLEAERA